MGLAKTTDYRGYQITTLIEPTFRPICGFIGHVNVIHDGTNIVTDSTEVFSNVNIAAAIATKLGKEMIDIVLGPLESDPK